MTGELRVVIVGGGLGAVRTAQTVRDLGHRGEVRILSAESEIPYDRPPLSKNHLAGCLDDSALALRLQCVGRIDPDSELAIVAGDTTDNSFVAQFRTDGRVTGVLAVDEVRRFLRRRRELRSTEEAPR